MRQRLKKRSHTETWLPQLDTLPDQQQCVLESLDLPIPSIALARQLMFCVAEAERELSCLSISDADFINDCRAYLESLRIRLQAVAPAFDSVELPPMPELPSWPSLVKFTSLLDKIKGMASQLPFPVPSPPVVSLEALRSYMQTQTIQPLMKRRNTISDALYKGMAEGERLLDELKDAVKHEGEKIAGLLSHEADLFKEALSAGKHRLLHYHELPFGWQNNQYIQTGYRFLPAERWHVLLGSLFTWHNETINIHSHLWGFFIVLHVILHYHPHTPQSVDFYDNLVSLSFLLCAAACLLLSAAWHTASGCASWHIFHSAACFDYSGVSALITSSIFTMIWYGFYCRPDLLNIYGTASIGVGVLGLFLPWTKTFNERRNKPYRILFFLSMCLSAIAPQVHMMFLYGLRETVLFYAPVLTSVLSYLVGLVLYASNVPESIRPGPFFDYIAHSHQFWHVAILVAIWLQWKAVSFMHEHGTKDFSCAVTQPQSLLQAFLESSMH